MLECKKIYLLACYVFFFRQIISIYFESNLGYLAIVLVGKGRLSPICLLWLWAAQWHQFSFISRNCSQMETNFHTYSIWYIHASHCHHVIAIRIYQVREHHQPSPFIFYPNSLWSPDPWANIKPHWLLVDTACPVLTRQDLLHLSINQTTLTSFQLFADNVTVFILYC